MKDQNPNNCTEVKGYVNMYKFDNRPIVDLTFFKSRKDAIECRNKSWEYVGDPTYVSFVIYPHKV